MKNCLFSLVVLLFATPALAGRTITVVQPRCQQPQVGQQYCGPIVIIRERRPRKVTHYGHLLPPVQFHRGYGSASRQSSAGVTYGGGWAAPQEYVEPLVIENPFFKE